MCICASAPKNSSCWCMTTIRLPLSRPADWIIPNFETLMPKTHDDARLLGAFQRLDTVLPLAIYTPSDAIPEPKALSLCAASSMSGLLHSSPHHADFHRWYRSPGGKAPLPDDIANIVAADRPAVSRPSYDDLNISSPGPHEESATRKRLQRQSGKHGKPSDADKAVVSADQAGGGGVADRLRDLVLQAERQETMLRQRTGEAEQRLAHLAVSTAAD